MATKLSETGAAAMRAAMIDSQLRTNDVIDPDVVAAMAAVPREAFVPAALSGVAYMDRAIALGQGRALNAPLVTGRMLVAAAVRPGQRVLLVGSATGYTAALLAQLGAEVTAVEEASELMAAAQAAGVHADEVLHVGDHALQDVLGARAAGMQAAWVNREQAAWEHAERPHVELGDLSELVQTLDERRVLKSPE